MISMTDTKVSIIICTRNRADSLREMLASIGRCDVPADLPTELLVVDNGSTDHTREITAHAELTNIPVRYIHEPRKGKGYAYNTGMANARGNVFLFTDDDVRVPRQWVDEMTRPIMSAHADAVQGQIELAAEVVQPWMTGLHREMLAEVIITQEISNFGIVGANMAFSRAAAGAIGPFDVQLGPGALGYADDTEFGWRLRKAGFRVIGLPTHPVIHHPDATRLTRVNLIEIAMKLGRTWGYLTREQKTSGPPSSHWQFYRAWLRLQYWRLRRLREWIGKPYCPGWELLLIRELAMRRSLVAHPLNGNQEHV